MKTWPGILDRVAFPTQLTAQVVTPTADPRIHGYAVQADLGRHADFLDVAWLAFTGEVPSAGERAALSLALIWLAPVAINESPTHAAVLAKVAGAPEEVVPAIAAVAVGQQTAAECAALAPLFAWLDAGVGLPPAAWLEPEPTAGQAEAWSALATQSAHWFGAERALPAAPVLRRVAGAYALLHRLGVRDLPRLHALSLWARLPTILAEAACAASGAVMTYPAHLPAYQYVEDEVGA